MSHSFPGDPRLPPPKHAMGVLRRCVHFNHIRKQSHLVVLQILTERPTTSFGVHDNRPQAAASQKSGMIQVRPHVLCILLDVAPCDMLYCLFMKTFKFFHIPHGYGPRGGRGRLRNESNRRPCVDLKRSEKLWTPRTLPSAYVASPQRWL